MKLITIVLLAILFGLLCSIHAARAQLHNNPKCSKYLQPDCQLIYPVGGFVLGDDGNGNIGIYSNATGKLVGRVGSTIPTSTPTATFTAVAHATCVPWSPTNPGSHYGDCGSPLPTPLMRR
jgi:hypothetical protein